MNDITFIIHTFKRPEQSQRLLDSIHKFYPDAKTLVYDDSEHDKGVSWGRNHLVSRVQTDYFLLLEDDFIFTERTNIEKLKTRILKGYDVVAGCLTTNGVKSHYEGVYDLTEGVLTYVAKTEEPYEFVFNFFLGRTETFRTVKWDEELKIGEHTAFFFEHRGKLKISYVGEVEVEHKQVKTPEYLKYRNRAWKFLDVFLKKYNLKEIRTFDGTVAYKLGDYKTLK